MNNFKYFVILLSMWALDCVAVSAKPIMKQVDHQYVNPSAKVIQTSISGQFVYVVPHQISLKNITESGVTTSFEITLNQPFSSFYQLFSMLPPKPWSLSIK